MSEDSMPIESPLEVAAPADSAELIHLKSRLGGSLVVAEEKDLTLKLEATVAGLTAVCEALKLDPDLAFDYPADLTAWDTGESFVVWYRLWSMERKRTAIVRVTLPREDPAVPSLTYLWPGFNWFEREVYDLYGIRFEGHPEQEDSTRMRILLPEDWVGFPFRRDYEPVFEDDPLHGPQRTN